MQKYFIGIDSGTTGIKAVLFDLTGKEISKSSQPLTGIFPEENQYEEDSKEIWDKCKLCVNKLVNEHPDKIISGVGITAQGDGVWMFDEKMEPVRNGCCFCDGRAGKIIDRWVEDGTCDKLFELTGTRIFSGNQNGIVKWMEENEPDNLEKSRWLLHLKDYLFYKFTNQITTDASDQSLIFLNQKTRQYSNEVFELCKLEQYKEKYAFVLEGKENAFPIEENVAEELGLSKDIIVTSGPMDVSACALGSGVIENAHCCSIIGTAALHEMVIDKPLCDYIKAGMTVTHVMEDRWLRLMASLAGAPNLEWVITTFGGMLKEEAKKEGVSIYDYVEKMVADVPIGASGIIYHPFLLAGGERAPFVNSHARASFTGISVRHTMADILRATYEGVAFAMMDCYQHMPQKAIDITLCGGGANSRVWCQMFADAVGIRTITVEGDELGAKGVFIHNAVVQGYFADYKTAVEDTVKVKEVYEPNMINHKKYKKYFKLYKETYVALQKIWTLRADLIYEE